jgi:hypothetical protein
MNSLERMADIYDPYVFFLGGFWIDIYLSNTELHPAGHMNDAKKPQNGRKVLADLPRLPLRNSNSRMEAVAWRAAVGSSE